MNTNLKLKALSPEEISYIYNTYMKNDFPPSELKPLSSILENLNNGNYFCYGLIEDEKLKAYAYLCKSPNKNCLLMDYYAVLNNIRSKGYGSLFLKLLKENLNNYDGIIFEVESKTTAKDFKEKAICEKRIKFYLNNGLYLTNISILLFGVTLNIFFLPILKQLDDNTIYNELDSIYKILYSKNIYKNNLILYYN